VPQYVGAGLKTYVPRLVGQTAAAQQKKSPGSEDKRKWNENEFMTELSRTVPPAQVDVARRLLTWANTTGLRIWWGQGKKHGSFFPMFDYAMNTYWTFAVWTYSGVELQFQHMQGRPPFGEIDKRREMLVRLNKIPGINLSDSVLTRRPSVPFAVLEKQENLEGFLRVWEWYLDEIRRNIS
jgi:hypothetical protein